jgi:hypothetical protein
MSLKRFLPVFAFALLLVPAMASAVTYNTPTWGAVYSCDYTVAPYPRIDGISVFALQSTQTDALGRPIHRSIEYFDATYGTENYKATWAKPVNKTTVHGVPYTNWELSFLNGAQCTKADVYFSGLTLVLDGCSDGTYRVCYRY